MYWINFLHIYQPYSQTNEILKRVVNESYRPLLRGFLEVPNLKVNLNINGSLTEILYKKGYKDVIETIKELSKRGKLEFTESANYHALLPFLEEKEIIRQIKRNNKINKKYFGSEYKPFCLFPPEMAYGKRVAKIVSKMGYKMMIIDEISYDGGKSSPNNQFLYKVKGSSIIPVFRERRVSNSIMSAVVRNKKDFLRVVGESKDNFYFCTAMDGETFGHHRPGLEKDFLNILNSKYPEQIFISQLLNLFKVKEEINLVNSTWASSKEDIERGVQFYSWKDPKNLVHKLQWKFLNYLLEITRSKKVSYSKLNIVDEAVASDQFFWASGEPWWSIEMIEKGAFQLLYALKKITNNKEEIEKGENYYKEILSIAFWWQREGKIEERSIKYKENVKIPFRERTIEDGKPEVYNAFINMMKEKMKEAVQEKNFEKAILWRDAIIKIENKNDIYDAMHATDLLRIEVSDKSLRELMDKYKEEYKKIKPGQPEFRHFD